jgi:KUP system potassium uptake protein
VAPTHENVLGVLSLILYALVIVVSIKYISIVMRADNQGEGGILALTALVPESKGRPSRSLLTLDRPIYVPQVNWALAVCTILIVLGFQSSSALAATYGIALTITMVITALLLYVVATERWKWPLWVAIAVTTAARPGPVQRADPIRLHAGSQRAERAHPRARVRSRARHG